MKLSKIVVHMDNYNFTKFHQNRMKNKNVLLIARFSVQNFKVSVESWKSYIVWSWTDTQVCIQASVWLHGSRWTWIKLICLSCFQYLLWLEKAFKKWGCFFIAVHFKHETQHLHTGFLMTADECNNCYTYRYIINAIVL